MKRLFVVLMLAIAAAAYFSHADTAAGSVCYAADCPDGCGGDGGSDPDGTGGGDDDDSGPDGTGDGSGDSGGGSDPDGSGGGGDF